MVGAFLSGKRVGMIGYQCSPAVWGGYGKGVFISMGVFFVEAILGSLLILIYDGVDEFSGVIIMMMIFTFTYIIFTALVGFILYTASSFFGYGIGKQTYVSTLIEKEANKTCEEIENDIKAKQRSKPYLH